MLGLNGGIRLWYIEGINNMRYGKYRLFCEEESLDMDPYNGDGYIFMSKDRQILKITVSKTTNVFFTMLLMKRVTSS